MPRLNILESVPVKITTRTVQLSGLFDLPLEDKVHFALDLDLPIEQRPWNIGLIVGPSGSGKSTILRKLWPEAFHSDLKWDQNQAIIDCFPAEMSIKKIIEIMGSIGFNSPPDWLKPFHILSNGEKFRVYMARRVSESQGIVIADEFSSVVDRQVAKIVSHSIQKYIRQSNRKFIAASCNYDIIEWLCPDWIYDTLRGQLDWREVQGRPRITVEIRRCGKELWKIFAPYH